MNKLIKISNRTAIFVIAMSAYLLPEHVKAGDWSQWRGSGRDAKVAGFLAPKTWPTELIQKWKITVGKGDATPALVGDRIYAYVNDASNDITLCCDAHTGKELWRDTYATQPASVPMGQHPGPRSSPAVADGKIVLYGACGILSCLDAATGRVVWRKDDFTGLWPKFFTSSSPLITDNLCIAQLGGEKQGGVVAYDLATGQQKWKWTEDGTAYSSPVLLTVGGTKMVVAMAAQKVVGLALTDGKLLWALPFVSHDRAYNVATPIVDGQTVIYTGSSRGTKAVQIEQAGDGFAAKELWSNPTNAVQFNSPVLKGGQIYGISAKGDLFCCAAQSGKALWSIPLHGGGFGTLVDAGPVLFALTPAGELVVFAPSDKEFKKVISYKIGTDTFAYPVIADTGIYMKDKNSLTLWTFD